jgi:uncharacterized protein YjiS (DUF1127 family)
MQSRLSHRSAPESRNMSSFGLLGRIREHYLKLAARHQLLALDDRMLKDIGISRSDIDRFTKS